MTHGINRKGVEGFWYQVRPVTYFLMKPEDQNACINAFKEFINTLRHGLTIYSLRKHVVVRHEDLRVDGLINEFFIHSREPTKFSGLPH